MSGLDLTTIVERHPWMLEIRSVIESIANMDGSVLLYNLIKVTEIAAPPLTKEERDLAKAEEEEQARRGQAWLEPIDAHNEACRAFARTGSDGELICPHCGRRSRENIEFVDYTRPGSEVILRVPGLRTLVWPRALACSTNGVYKLIRWPL
jgi:hypothetical protein